MDIYSRTFTSDRPTDHHVDIFRLQSSQPLPPETDALQVHQDPAGHLKPRHHLESKHTNIRMGKIKKKTDLLVR